MALRIQQTDDQPMMLMQQQWSQELNPLLANALTQGASLTQVMLSTGDNTFNHYLGRQMKGWLISDQSAAASIYRSTPLNNQTLTLNASAPVTVNLWVF